MQQQLALQFRSRLATLPIAATPRALAAVAFAGSAVAGRLATIVSGGASPIENVLIVLAAVAACAAGTTTLQAPDLARADRRLGRIGQRVGAVQTVVCLVVAALSIVP